MSSSAVHARLTLTLLRRQRWVASRTIIRRRLKGLEHVIAMTVVDPLRDERGWRFGEPDPVNGVTFLSKAYEAT